MRPGSSSVVTGGCSSSSTGVPNSVKGLIISSSVSAVGRLTEGRSSTVSEEGISGCTTCSGISDDSPAYPPYCFFLFLLPALIAVSDIVSAGNRPEVKSVSSPAVLK